MRLRNVKGAKEAMIEKKLEAKKCASKSFVENVKEFLNAIKTDKPIGKKLDFIVQEMNREANTIGSKASDIEICSYVVEIKSEIEKVREQIQNIE